MRVVDHQPQPLWQRSQVRQQTLHHRPAVQIRRRGQRPHQRRSGHRATQRVSDRDPEQPRIALAPVHRDPRHVLGQAGRGGPGPHEHGLPAPRRGRYLNHAFGFGQPPEQRVARHDPFRDSRSARNINGPGPVKTDRERSQLAGSELTCAANSGCGGHPSMESPGAGPCLSSSDDTLPRNCARPLRGRCRGAAPRGRSPPGL